MNVRPNNRIEEERTRTAAMGDGGVRRDDRSVGQLLRELSTEGGDLVQQEIALAKAEISEKIDVFQRNLVAMATGATLLLAAVLFVAWAANMGLTALLAQFMDAAVAVWLSPLILGAALALVGWGMVSSGRRSIRREGLTPHRTTSTLQEDSRWARDKAREVREEVRHG